MLIDRSRRGPVRHFEWRVRLFGAGAILALAGMYAEQSWMIDVAIAVLLLGVLLRFLPGQREDGEHEENEEAEDDGDDRGGAGS